MLDVLIVFSLMFAVVLGIIGLLLAWTMLRPSHKESVNRTIDMMEDADAWTFNYCTADHNSGVSIWTANLPIVDLGFYKPCEMKLRCTDAFRLRRALSALRSRKLRNVFDKIDQDERPI